MLLTRTRLICIVMCVAGITCHHSHTPKYSVEKLDYKQLTLFI